MTNCKYAINFKSGVEQYIRCSISHQLCAFQRYCVDEGRVINTESSETCVAKARYNFSEEENVLQEKAVIQEDVVVQEEVTVKDTKKKKKDKKFGIVTLVAKNYFIYDFGGKSAVIRGKHKYAIGDKVEL